MYLGDQETQTVYYNAGQNANGPLAYLSDINDNRMMIAVQMDKQAEFDAPPSIC